MESEYTKWACLFGISRYVRWNKKHNEIENVLFEIMKIVRRVNGQRETKVGKTPRNKLQQDKKISTNIGIYHNGSYDDNEGS